MCQFDAKDRLKYNQTVTEKFEQCCKVTDNTVMVVIFTVDVNNEIIQMKHNVPSQTRPCDREVSLCLLDTFGNTFYTSRWLHDIVKPSHTIRINMVCKTTTSCIFGDCIGYNRVSIGRLRTCFGSTLAFYQIRDENRAKLKSSYSCGHRVSKSARYDATFTVSQQ